MKPACTNLHNKEMIITCGFHNDMQKIQILEILVY